MELDGHLIARTGYTGEDGFEIFVPKDKAAKLWDELLKTGGSHIKPCGLGARDTLRTEMKYSLYGNEIDDSTNPYASGLGWVVKPKLKDFLGRSEIVSAKEAGGLQKLIGLALTDRGIPRKDYRVLSPSGEAIGRVTSGTLSPSTGEAIGIAFADKEYAPVGTELCVEIRNRSVKAKVVETPFYKNAGA